MFNYYLTWKNHSTLLINNVCDLGLTQMLYDSDRVLIMLTICWYVYVGN